MRTTVWLVAVALLGITVPAGAQERKVEGYVGGGYSAIVGEARDHTGDAGVFQAGVQFNFTPKLGFRTNYDYSALGKEKTVLLPVSPTPGASTSLQEFSADGHMHDVTFDLVMKGNSAARAVPYGLVGPGIFHRTVNLTTPATGFTTICDPYWYVCYPVAVSVDQVIGTRSSTDFGMNFGGGMSFKVGERTSVYFDVRYIYVWGPTFDVPAVGSNPARSVHGNAQAIPFTFGVRF